MNLLLATITVFYPLLTGQTFEACVRKVGAPVPTCLMSSEEKIVHTVDEGASFDVWVKVNGIETTPRRVDIPIKKPPTLIVGPTIVVTP